jgi:hypothetical protein
MQTHAQYWECLLFIFGSRLEQTKFLAYLIIYDRDKQGDPTMRKRVGTEADIQLTCANNAEVNSITVLDPDTAHKTLGARMSPAGNMAEEYKSLRLKASRAASKISGTKLPASMVYLYYTTKCTKTMEYSVAVTTSTKDTAEKIH